jgi:hypothetical protein
MALAPKPKRWRIADENEGSKIWRYENWMGHEDGPPFWIELRYVKATGLFTGVRSELLELADNQWARLSPPQANQAVARRRALELCLRVAAETIVRLRESQASSDQ